MYLVRLIRYELNTTHINSQVNKETVHAPSRYAIEREHNTNNT
jgi:hypothetical protein